jgi:hypothetical protein
VTGHARTAVAAVLARYPCTHLLQQHDPALPPEYFDHFGYRGSR